MMITEIWIDDDEDEDAGGQHDGKLAEVRDQLLFLKVSSLQYNQKGKCHSIQ